MTATVGDLKNYISDKWRDYCAADPTRTKPCEFRTRFKDWEAEFFMSGLKRNLFSIVAPCNCKTAAQCHLHYKALGEEVLKNFFDKGGVGAGREAVTQFAAITQLMDIYGYPTENIKAESGEKGESEPLGIDALVFDGPRQEQGSVRIAMEAKKKDTLDRLFSQIVDCVKRGKHEIEVHGNRKDEKGAHKNFQAIIEWQPAYLWLVCPTERHAYSVRHSNQKRFSLKRIADIPKFTASSP